MPVELIPAFLFYCLVSSITPGPANLCSLASALNFGKKQALVQWRGLFTGFTIISLTSVFVAYFIGTAIGEYVKYLSYLGAAYILWLAWKMLRYQGVDNAEAKDCTFTSGMLIQLTNAKMLLFELTVFSTYVLPYSERLLDLFLVAPLLLIAGPGANFAWLYAGAYLRRFLHRYRKQVDLVMAILLAACAIYIFFI